jgi:hypothetical protein
MTLLMEKRDRQAIVEPHLTETSAGFFALLYRNSEHVDARLFRDRHEAEDFARDWIERRD